MITVFKNTVFFYLSLLSLTAFAGVPESFHFEGQLLDSADVPVSSPNVAVKIEILNPSGSCSLYEETRTLDTTSTNGWLSMDIGSVQGAAVRSAGDLGLSMQAIFSNSGPVGCFSSPAQNDGRKLRVTILSIGGTAVNDVLSDKLIGSVPFATHAAVAATAKSISVSANLSANSFRLTDLGAPVTGNDAVTKNYADSNLMGLPVFASLPAAGNVLQFDGASWVATAVSGGGGGGATLSVNVPLTNSGTATNPILGINQANGATNGYLTNTDWTNFNSKMSNSLTSGNIWIGNGGNAATANPITGDINMSNSGAVVVNKLQTYPMSITAPTSGQYLRFSGSTWTNSPLNVNEVMGGILPLNFGGTGSAGPFNMHKMVKVNSTGTGFEQFNCAMNELVGFNSSGEVTCLSGPNSPAVMRDGNSSGPLTFGTNDNTSVHLETNGSVAVYVKETGNVGIGYSSPMAKLQVLGQIVSNEYVGAGSNVDFLNGNSHVISSVGGSVVNLSSTIPGGHYTVLITDSTPRTYTFSGGGCSSFRYNPANGATTAGHHALYEIYRSSAGGGTCYVRWTLMAP